jgi:hypothetical protein
MYMKLHLGLLQMLHIKFRDKLSIVIDLVVCRAKGGNWPGIFGWSSRQGDPAKRREILIAKISQPSWKHCIRFDPSSKQSLSSEDLSSNPAGPPVWRNGASID